eukprot:TRINITY_DN19081_c0_g1_i1.p1 TRINITY_DN19081_c0_g1~~TRINITY_DN19081_c0_g1_i1.p1  ORF type:complete len:2815 (+),score=784.75 TRINITY_DN19081_c0_g1_i1:127-8445(+)
MAARAQAQKTPERPGLSAAFATGVWDGGKLPGASSGGSERCDSDEDGSPRGAKAKRGGSESPEGTAEQVQMLRAMTGDQLSLAGCRRLLERYGGSVEEASNAVFEMLGQPELLLQLNGESAPPAPAPPQGAPCAEEADDGWSEAGSLAQDSSSEHPADPAGDAGAGGSRAAEDGRPGQGDAPAVSVRVPRGAARSFFRPTVCAWITAQCAAAGSGVSAAVQSPGESGESDYSSSEGDGPGSAAPDDPAPATAAPGPPRRSWTPWRRRASSEPSPGPGGGRKRSRPPSGGGPPSDGRPPPSDGRRKRPRRPREPPAGAGEGEGGTVQCAADRRLLRALLGERLRRAAPDTRRRALGLAREAVSQRGGGSEWTLRGAGAQWGHVAGPPGGPEDCGGAARAVALARRRLLPCAPDRPADGPPETVLPIPAFLLAPAGSAQPEPSAAVLVRPLAGPPRVARRAARIAARKVVEFCFSVSPAVPLEAVAALALAARRRWADTVLCIRQRQRKGRYQCVALGLGAPLARAWLQGGAGRLLMSCPERLQLCPNAAGALCQRSGSSVAPSTAKPPHEQQTVPIWEVVDRTVEGGWRPLPPYDSLTLETQEPCPGAFFVLGALPGALWYLCESTGDGSASAGTRSCVIIDVSESASARQALVVRRRPLAQGGTALLRVGDWVRVRGSVQEPRTSWNKVQRCDVGVVQSVAGASCVVRFPFEDGHEWRGYIPDLEHAREPLPMVDLDDSARHALADTVEVVNRDTGHVIRFQAAPALHPLLIVEGKGPLAHLSGKFHLCTHGQGGCSTVSGMPMWVRGPKTCRHGHRLHNVSHVRTAWACNGACSREFDPREAGEEWATERYNCRLCHFDLCGDCLGAPAPVVRDRWQKQEPAAPPASAPAAKRGSQSVRRRRARRSDGRGPPEGSAPIPVWEYRLDSGEWEQYAAGDREALERARQAGRSPAGIVGFQGGAGEVRLVDLRAMQQVDPRTGKKWAVRRRELLPPPPGARLPPPAPAPPPPPAGEPWICRACGAQAVSQECPECMLPRSPRSEGCATPRHGSEAGADGDGGGSDGDPGAEEGPPAAGAGQGGGGPAQPEQAPGPAELAQALRDTAAREEGARAFIERQQAFAHFSLNSISADIRKLAAECSPETYGNCVLYSHQERWRIEVNVEPTGGRAEAVSAPHEGLPPDQVQWEGPITVRRPRSVAEPIVRSCPQGHDLEETTRPLTVCCCRCRQLWGGVPALECKHCGWAICAKCREQGPPLCPRGHVMELSDYAEGEYQSGWLCDNAPACESVRGDPYNTRWFCLECRSEYCLNCCGRSPGVRYSIGDLTPGAPGSEPVGWRDWAIRKAEWTRDGRVHFPELRRGIRLAGPDVARKLWELTELFHRAGVAITGDYNQVPSALATVEAWARPPALAEGWWRRVGPPGQGASGAQKVFVAHAHVIFDAPCSDPCGAADEWWPVERDSDGEILVRGSRIVRADGKLIEWEDGDVWIRGLGTRSQANPPPRRKPDPGPLRVAGAVLDCLASNLRRPARPAPAVAAAEPPAPPPVWAAALGPGATVAALRDLLAEEARVHSESLCVPAFAREVVREHAAALARRAGLREATLQGGVLRMRGCGAAFRRARWGVEQLTRLAALADQVSSNAVKMERVADRLNVAEVRVPLPPAAREVLALAPAAGQLEGGPREATPAAAVLKQVTVAATEGRAQVHYATFDGWGDEVKRMLVEAGVHLAASWDPRAAQMPGLRQGEAVTLQRPRVGSKVRVSPMLAVGDQRDFESLRRVLKQDESGVVSAVRDDGCTVTFPRHKGWRALPGEVEVIAPPPPKADSAAPVCRPPHLRAPAVAPVPAAGCAAAAAPDAEPGEWLAQVCGVSVALEQDGWPRVFCQQLHRWLGATLDPASADASPPGRPTVLAVQLRPASSASGGTVAHVVCPSSSLLRALPWAEEPDVGPLGFAAHRLLSLQWAQLTDGYLLELLGECLSEDRVGGHSAQWHHVACLRALRRSDELRLAARQETEEVLGIITRAEEWLGSKPHAPDSWDGRGVGAVQNMLQQFRRKAEDNLKEWEEHCTMSEFAMRRRCDALRQKLELSERAARRVCRGDALLRRIERLSGALTDYDPDSGSVLIRGPHACVHRARHVLEQQLSETVGGAAQETRTLAVPTPTEDTLRADDVLLRVLQQQTGLSGCELLGGGQLRVEGTTEQVSLASAMCGVDAKRPEPFAAAGAAAAAARPRGSEVELLCGHSAPRTLSNPPKVCPEAGCGSRLTLRDQMSLAPAECVRRTTAAYVEAACSADRSVVRCPKCGRWAAVAGPAGHPTTVDCPNCRTAACSVCGEAAHFATPCARGRKRRRQEPGEGGEPGPDGWGPETVPCPNCHADVRREGSANYQSCPLCRCEFCWRCLRRECRDSDSCQGIAGRASELAKLQLQSRARRSLVPLRSESSCGRCGVHPLPERYGDAKQCVQCASLLLCGACAPKGCPNSRNAVHCLAPLPLQCPEMTPAPGSRELPGEAHALMEAPGAAGTLAGSCSLCKQRAELHCGCGFAVCSACSDETVLQLHAERRKIHAAVTGAQREQPKAKSAQHGAGSRELAGRRMNCMVHDGWVYSTLADADPCGSTVTTQLGGEHLPAGWEIAPDEPGVVNGVVVPRTWSTHMIVLAGGTAYKTGYYRTGQAGTQWRQECLLQDESGLRPSFRSGHILIRRRWAPSPVAPAAVSVDGTFWKQTAKNDPGGSAGWESPEGTPAALPGADWARLGLCQMMFTDLVGGAPRASVGQC